MRAVHLRSRDSWFECSCSFLRTAPGGCLAHSLVVADLAALEGKIAAGFDRDLTGAGDHDIRPLDADVTTALECDRRSPALEDQFAGGGDRHLGFAVDAEI